MQLVNTGMSDSPLSCPKNEILGRVSGHWFEEKSESCFVNTVGSYSDTYLISRGMCC